MRGQIVISNTTRIFTYFKFVMKFLIVTPCRNAAPLLRSTIDSVLRQTSVLRGEVELEYWIIDGASTDSTRSIVESYSDSRIHFNSEPDGGMYEALAKGLRKGSGDVIAYLNAGDVYFPHAFEVISEIFTHECVDWITGYTTLMNDSEQITAAWKPPRYRREFILNGTYLSGYPVLGIQQESTFWSARANGTIDLERLASFRLAGDYFLWTELARSFELHSAMTQLGVFRQHAGQLSEQTDAYSAEARGATRAKRFREKLTAYWDFRCNPLWKKYLWNFILPPSRARLFECLGGGQRWEPR